MQNRDGTKRGSRQAFTASWTHPGWGEFYLQPIFTSPSHQHVNILVYLYISYQTPPYIYLTTVEYPLIGVYFIVGKPFMLIFTTKSPMHVYPRDPLRVYFIFVCPPSSELNIAMCFYYSWANTISCWLTNNSNSAK